MVYEVKEGVVLEGVEPVILKALDVLGAAHLALFDKVLVVTGGKEPGHAESGLHPRGCAVDVRTADLVEGESLLFGTMVAWYTYKHWMAFFDERSLIAGPHFHIEYRYGREVPKQ